MRRQRAARQVHGRREVAGILKGYDALLNLVLDETREYLKDPDDRTGCSTRPACSASPSAAAPPSRSVPADGFEEIANPFLQEGGDDEEPPEQ